MYMKASNMTLGDRILFENNEASSGGALFIAGSSILTLAGDSISFARNTATVYGGGLRVYQSTTNITGKAVFFGNTAEFGGAIFADAGIFSVIGDAVLSNNFANDSGGAFYSGNSSIDITGTIVWVNNSAFVGGGGLMLWETAMHVQVLGKTAFMGNTAEFGGAAYMSTSMLVLYGGIHFSENTVNVSGGALYNNMSTINISGNALWENNRSPVGGGGLLVWESNVYVQSSGTVAFVGNSADLGGAAYIDSSTVLTDGDASFSGNLAHVDGGALYAGLSDVDIAGSTVWESNTPGERGGSIVTFQSEMIVQPSGKALFAYNVATYFGGAAYLSNSTILFIGDVMFAANVVGESGGALYSNFSAITVAKTAIWKDNSAEVGGGGLLMWNSTLHVDYFGRAEYVGNIANWGGAIYSFKSRILFDGDVRFANNFVDDRGGGLYSDRSAVNVTGTASWENNTSLNSGGGAAMWTSTMYIVAGSNVSFSKNTAPVGGGMFIGVNAAVVITGLATFSHNTAETGAGIKMATFSSVNFTGGLVMMQGNLASSSGGGIHCESPTLLELDGVEFASNYGGVSGGAMIALLAGTERIAETEAKPAVISNCCFSDNTVTDAGGALFIGGGFIDITDSHFYNNVAGDAVYYRNHRS